MKRVGNLYYKVCSLDNLYLAHKNARRGKTHYSEVKKVDASLDYYMNQLHLNLTEKKFKNSPYTIFTKVCGKKTRVIHKLPYYPDRVVHHAIMQVLEPIWTNIFILDTYSSIKGRGIHFALKRLRNDLRKNHNTTKYCLKVDIKKFYPSIDNDILKKIVRKKIKDQDLLWLLDEIIDSEKGVPIGNYLSQYFANLYLAYFDHDVKEIFGVKHYYRYCDDIVILHESKKFLHGLLIQINNYLNEYLNLQLKRNYQVFPVEKRGIDFLGYVIYPTHTLIRKSIKKDMIHKLDTSRCKKTAASYYGWLIHANAYNLRTKYLQQYERTFSNASRELH